MSLKVRLKVSFLFFKHEAEARKYLTESGKQAKIDKKVLHEKIMATKDFGFKYSYL